MRISIIVAVAENSVIGLDGQLPWRLPNDLRHFKAVTMGKPVVMGRRTWESLGRPLPGRRNVVVSSRAEFQPEGAEVVVSLSAALDLLAGAEEIFIIGGARLYAEAFPLAHRVYLTEVHAAVPGDTCCPAWDRSAWREIHREEHAADERHAFSFAFVTLDRIG
ncbi:MAG TPA: dihydrofolate reductase [Kiritimatiellia bacterium]|nr:dihydrofolate reductase [Kiritimatiellia bacterium]